MIKYFKYKITLDLYANPTAPATISKMKMIPNRTANVVTIQQFSLIAPQHPRNPTQKTITPTTMRNTGTLAKLLSAYEKQSPYLSRMNAPMIINARPLN